MTVYRSIGGAVMPYMPTKEGVYEFTLADPKRNMQIRKFRIKLRNISENLPKILIDKRPLEEFLFKQWQRIGDLPE